MPKELVRKRGKRKPKSDPVPTPSTSTATSASAPTAAAALAPPPPSDGRDAGYGQRRALHAAQEKAAYGGAGDDGERGGAGEGAGGEASWITPADGGLGSIRDRVEGDAPWGFVDPEVKAYFRTVDEKLKAFEAAGMPEGETAEEENEDRQLLLTAALAELRGKELQLATDSDCALILERMCWNMGDWGRRVFADALMGNFEKLIQHRFGSHVVQTLLTLGAKTIDREERGRFPPQQARATSDDGVLPLFSAQVADLVAELLPTLPLLLQSPFSSHPVRVLLLLLAGRPIPSAAHDGAAGGSSSSSAVRSKRSEKFAQQNANFKLIVDAGGEDDVRSGEALRVPEALKGELKRFWRTVRFEVSPVEIRALGVGNVSGPVLQMLVELEAEGGEADEDGSLLDSLLCGLVASSRAPDAPAPERQDYVEHLLRDQAGSHLLEALLLHAPPRIFSLLWSTYFTGRLGKLGVHPVGNYVVAKGVRRLDADELAGVLGESGEWARAVKRSRLGVISAVVNRSAELGQHGQAVLEAVCTAFEIKGKEQEGYLVPCLLSLKPRRRYRKAAGLPAEEGDDAGSDDELAPEPVADLLPPVLAEGAEAAPPTADDLNRLKRKLGHQRKIEEDRDPLAPTVQGCLLAQALLKLGPDEAEVVVNSLLAQNMDDLLAIAHSSIGSRLIDAILDTPAVPFKLARRVVLAFAADSFFALVDDRLGSRVGEKIWSKCDGFLKEKIAKALAPFEVALATSQYGRFFGRKLNLNFYKRKPMEWRRAQAAADAAAAAAPVAAPAPAVKAAQPTPTAGAVDAAQPPAGAEKKRKRAAKVEADDELDAIFSTAGPLAGTGGGGGGGSAPSGEPSKEDRKAAKRAKKSAAAAAAAAGAPVADDGMSAVLGAIRESAGGEPAKRKKAKAAKGE